MGILARYLIDAAQMEQYASAYVLFNDDHKKTAQNPTWFMIHGTDCSRPITEAIGGYKLVWLDTAPK